MPGGDRRRVSNGSRTALPGARLPTAGSRQRRRIGAGASPWHDLRPGSGIRADSVYRALLLRSGQGVDRIPDREQRNSR